jgi:hypothetical protein
MNLEEDLRQYRRRQHLSKLYDEDKLPIQAHDDPDRACQACGATPEWLDETTITLKGGAKQVIPGHYTKVRMLDVDERDICVDCFVREYYVRRYEQRPVSGHGHPGIPRSQARYDGDRFHSGEW